MSAYVRRLPAGVYNIDGFFKMPHTTFSLTCIHTALDRSGGCVRN